MKTLVQKWGNSLAVRIPKSFAEEVGLEKDSPVDVSLNDGKVIIAPTTQSKFTLDQLLGQISDENLHQEIETGTAVGNEAW